jgi:hypothetical protein
MLIRPTPLEIYPKQSHNQAMDTKVTQNPPSELKAAIGELFRVLPFAAFRWLARAWWLWTPLIPLYWVYSGNLWVMLLLPAPIGSLWLWLSPEEREQARQNYSNSYHPVIQDPFEPICADDSDIRDPFYTGSDN